MTEFSAIHSLNELIEQSDLLKRYPWLSAKLLSRWVNGEKIRRYTPRQNQHVYVEADILQAIEREMGSCEETKAPLSSEDNGSASKTEGPAGTGAGTLTEAERLYAEASKRRLLKKQKNG
ncbi:hypothetical protein OEG84_04750 [Hoeflea sp. G2-23]|uniref:DUF4224 domain-containing protein n=1 Tax=Hoeflea algicola TaxID=2983763 RepID=A0ABT3Z5J1_9HYPH|nr:hypothetical protein [Hoeflea algicola]MCY0147045.1 hypothetical protein [Hoeflea algicola]